MGEKGIFGQPPREMLGQLSKAATQAGRPLFSQQQLSRLLGVVLDDINDKVKDSGNLGIYMATARLSVLKNWADLRGTPQAYTKATVFSGIDKPKEIQDWCLRAGPAWDDFQNALATIQKEKAGAINTFWAKRLAMPQTCQ